jgi:hypothetical protein
MEMNIVRCVCGKLMFLAQVSGIVDFLFKLISGAYVSLTRCGHQVPTFTVHFFYHITVEMYQVSLWK